jgi:transcriptional regulator with XRE-family HTH domain
MTVLGKLIKEKLINSRLSMAEASRRAGQSPSYLKELTRGRIRNPGIVTLLAVAESVGLTIEALISAVRDDIGEQTEMTNEERALLDMYRRASPAGKARIFRTDISD